MKLKLKIDTDRLTVDDLIEIEEGSSRRVRQGRDLLARFVTDDEGNFLTFEEAKKVIGKLTITEMNVAVQQLVDGIKRLQESSIPPDNASS